MMFTIRIYTYDRAGYRFSFPLSLPALDRRRALHIARREVRAMNRNQLHKVRLVSFGRKGEGVRV
jgi:hypothetical protein